MFSEKYLVAFANLVGVATQFGSCFSCCHQICDALLEIYSDTFLSGLESLELLLQASFLSSVMNELSSYLVL
jgi:hypothetical protein